jgi:hypothetical protein
VTPIGESDHGSDVEPVTGEATHKETILCVVDMNVIAHGPQRSSPALAQDAVGVDVGLVEAFPVFPFQEAGANFDVPQPDDDLGFAQCQSTGAPWMNDETGPFEISAHGVDEPMGREIPDREPVHS